MKDVGEQKEITEEGNVRKDKRNIQGDKGEEDERETRKIGGRCSARIRQCHRIF
jgi:hypothetical protein